MIKESQLSGYFSRGHPRALCVALLALILIGVCCPCAPGRGAASSRRSRRRMTPLVFMQHLPSLPENSLGASGSPEGRIRGREDPRFKELVTNFNPDVVFKDDEGTGEDRIMTQRCKDRLNVLAKSVMIHWPGLRLRVVNAWENDRQGDHSLESLHYEGRAVDITTSDRDRTKYGMLARLAVEAGFDWVFYESRSHVHCSVKAENSIAAKYGGCFPGYATVLTEDGRRLEMSHLSVGDRILAVDRDGALQYSDVVAFLHRDVTQRMTFQRMRSAEGHDLTLTPDHMIYTTRKLGGELNWYAPRFAVEVQTGSFLYAAGATDEKPRVVRVVNVSTVVKEGVYAPLTSHGSVVVDGLVTSCYASFNSQSAAHMSMLPVRLAYRSILSGNSTEVRPEIDGVHWYARFLYQLAKQFFPQRFYSESQNEIRR